ncbi:hypothetical protein D3C76_779850 [compost metagenome]
MLHGNAVWLEFAVRADSREHQQVRTTECTGAEQHFLACLQGQSFGLVAHLYAGGLLAVEQHALGIGTGQYREVLALVANRLEKGCRGAPASAIVDGDVVGADTFLVDAVEIGIVAMTRGHAGGDEGVAGRVAPSRSADTKFTGIAMQFTFTGVMVFALAEVWQDVVERPARIAQCFPVIEVGAVTAYIDHAVDRAAATQGLAPWLIADAPVQPGLRHGIERPIDMPCGQDRRDADRGMNQRRPVLWPGFEQAYSHARVGAEAVGQDTAGGAGTDDDVVEFHWFYSRLNYKVSCATTGRRATRIWNSLPMGRKFIDLS